MKKPEWYQVWEQNPYMSHMHWAFLLIFLVSIANMMTTGINQIYSQNPAAAAAAIANYGQNRKSEPVPGQYIVIFNDDTPDAPGLAKKMVDDANGTKLQDYKTVFKGFAAKLPEQALNGIKNNPHVKLIEQDQTAFAFDTQVNPPSWGLDRIDQRNLPLDNSYTYGNNGTGVTAYVIDTGVELNHPEFGGRAFTGPDYIENDGLAWDCAGHGTHVAGTIGSQTYGIAKNVRIVAVRVLDCSGFGYWSQIIAGIDWVAANATKPAVANMSLGGSGTAANLAVTNAVKKGIVFAVAAGNSGIDACTVTPAGSPEAITVGALNGSDGQSGYSNFGPCVDIFAPGDGILSTYPGGGIAGLSGTSMASPHVAGVAALYLSANPSLTPAQVTAAMLQDATAGVMTSVSANTVNKILYMGNISQSANNPPLPPPPTTDTTAPSAPSLSASSNSPTSASLSWTTSSDDVGVTGYRVLRNGAQIASVTGTSYTDKTVSGGNQYTYTVRASDAAGNVSIDSNAVTVSVPLPTFSIVSYTVTSKTSSSVTITWSTTDPATGSVTYSRSGSNPATVNTATASANQSVTLTGLTRNTSYNFTITAQKSGASDTATVSGTFKTRPK